MADGERIYAQPTEKDWGGLNGITYFLRKIYTNGEADFPPRTGSKVFPDDRFQPPYTPKNLPDLITAEQEAGTAIDLPNDVLQRLGLTSLGAAKLQ